MSPLRTSQVRCQHTPSPTSRGPNLLNISHMPDTDYGDPDFYMQGANTSSVQGLSAKSCFAGKHFWAFPTPSDCLSVTGCLPAPSFLTVRCLPWPKACLTVSDRKLPALTKSCTVLEFILLVLGYSTLCVALLCFNSQMNPHSSGSSLQNWTVQFINITFMLSYWLFFIK